MNILKEEGLEDNIIVIFIFDYGFYLGEYCFWMKVSLYEELVWVLMIIKVFGKKVVVCYLFMELIDLYFIVVELVGLFYLEYL